MTDSILKEFSIEQLGIFVASCVGAFAICIKAIQKSRCSTINCCKGLLVINRHIPEVEQPVTLTRNNLSRLESGQL